MLVNLLQKALICVLMTLNIYLLIFENLINMRTSNSVMIFLSCFIGAGIGTLLSINFGLLWWVGILIGGFAGYLTYDYQKVKEAIPKAWKQSKANLKLPNLILILRIILNLIGILYVGVVFFSFSFFVKISIFLFAFLLVCGIFSEIISLLVAMNFYFPYQDDVNDKKIFNFWRLNRIVNLIDKKESKLFIFYLLLPLISIVMTSCYIFLFLKFLAKNTTPYFWIVINFFKNLFILIHSDIRLLVGINCLIGGIVGYSYDSVLVGMFAGGIIGVLSYRIISLKILKLKTN
jgi:hypothetical protein